MSHEKSTTIQVGSGKFANFKTVFTRNQATGKQRRVSDRQVKKMFTEGRLKPLGGKTFPSIRAAESAARARSDRTSAGIRKALKRK